MAAVVGLVFPSADDLAMLAVAAAPVRCWASRSAGRHVFVFDPQTPCGDDGEICDGLPGDPVHGDGGPPPAVIDMATVVACPGSGLVSLRSLGGRVLAAWAPWTSDTAVTHLFMACSLAPAHGFVVTGARWETVGWVLSGMVPYGWSGVA